MKYKIIKFVGCFNIVKIRDVFFTIYNRVLTITITLT